MVQGLVVIVGIYMLAAVSVHVAYRITRRTQGGEHSAHYVLHTCNDSRHLEWAIRSLTIYSWLCSRPVTITIQDEDSTDDTCRIASLLSRRYGLHMSNFITNSRTNSNRVPINHISRNSTTNLPAYSKINTSTNSKKRHLKNTQNDTSFNHSFTVSNTTHSFDPTHDVIHIRLSNPADWRRLPFAWQLN